MLFKAVILARAVDAVTGGGWIESCFLNSWIMKISEPSLIVAHRLHVSHSMHRTQGCETQAGSVPHTVQDMFGGSVSLSLKWENY